MKTHSELNIGDIVDVDEVRLELMIFTVGLPTVQDESALVEGFIAARKYNVPTKVLYDTTVNSVLLCTTYSDWWKLPIYSFNEIVMGELLGTGARPAYQFAEVNESVQFIGYVRETAEGTLYDPMTCKYYGVCNAP